MIDPIISAHGWTWTQLAVVLLLAALTLWQIYRWTIIPMPRHLRTLLLFLRLVWTALLIWCLWEPVSEKISSEEKMVRPAVTVMVDASASMALPDEKGQNRRQALDRIIPKLRELLEKADCTNTAWLAMGSRIRPWKDSLPSADKESRIIREIQEVVERQSSQLSGKVLFLLTDGEDTENTAVEEILPTLRRSGVRICPVIFGDGIGVPPIVRVERIRAPGRARVNESISILADLRIRQNQPVDFTVVLLRDGNVIQQKPIKGRGDGLQTVAFEDEIKEEGLKSYTVKIMNKEQSETFATFSTAVMAQPVSQKKSKVLYVQGTLEWEYKFLAQALNENPSLVLELLTRQSKERFERQYSDRKSEAGGIELLQKALKAAPENYDAIVLSNINPDLLTVEMQKNLLRMVRDTGGGILFFNGNFAQTSRFRGTLLEELLPVTFPAWNPSLEQALPAFPLKVPDERAFSIDLGSRMPLPELRAIKLTAEGKKSAIFYNSRANAPLADPPPTFVRCSLVQSVKPAAIVLAVHPLENARDKQKFIKGSKDSFATPPPAKALSGTGMPVFVIQSIGSGRSAFLGVDALWPWRMTSTARVRDYDIFWQQFLNWLCGQSLRDEAGLEMTGGPFKPGDKTRLTVRWPETGPALPGLAVKEAGNPEKEIKLSWNSDRKKATAEYEFKEEGEFLFMVRAAKEIVAHASVKVRHINLEQEYCGFNKSLLERLAKETEGSLLHEKDQNKEAMISILGESREIQVQRELKPLWHSPFIFIIMLIAYCAELLIRRRFMLT